jgi:hypothetical protein
MGCARSIISMILESSRNRRKNPWFYSFPDGFLTEGQEKVGFWQGFCSPRMSFAFPSGGVWPLGLRPRDAKLSLGQRQTQSRGNETLPKPTFSLVCNYYLLYKRAAHPPPGGSKRSHLSQKPTFCNLSQQVPPPAKHGFWETFDPLFHLFRRSQRAGTGEKRQNSGGSKCYHLGADVQPAYGKLGPPNPAENSQKNGVTPSRSLLDLSTCDA